MTKIQRDWLIKNNLDPEIYDVDAEGNVSESPIMGKGEAALRSAAVSVAPSLTAIPAAAGGGEAGALLGAPFGPLGILVGGGLGALSAGAAAAYATSKAQEALLERYSPETLQKLSQAQEEQPVSSYIGGFAPTALTARPSLKGLSELGRPLTRQTTLREAITKPAFVEPAMNVTANVAQATGQQVADLAQGGEFSGGRLAADIALGTVFNRPTRLGRKLGMSEGPQDAPLQKLDLERARFMAETPEEFTTPREERLGIGREKVAPEQFFGTEMDQRNRPISEEKAAKQYENWWKSEAEPTIDLIKQAAESVKLKIPRDRLNELANDPDVARVINDPTTLPEFLAKQSQDALQDAYENAAKQGQAAKTQTYKNITDDAADLLTKVDQGGVPGFITNNLKNIAEKNGIIIEGSDTPNSVIEKLRQKSRSYQETPDWMRPAPEDIAKAESIQKQNAEAGLMEEGLAAQDLLNEQKKMRNKQGVAAAREIYNDIYSRFQREGEGAKITQPDIDAAAKIAARRNLTIELDRPFIGSTEIRGMYLSDPKTGNRIVRVNPLMATRDTAIHEIGHDVFQGVTNPSMRKSLLESAQDSPAYKSELLARNAEVQEGKLTPKQAQELALEEGLIQSFGEQIPNIQRSEIRSWFNAFKASTKQLFTGKVSPEDAIAWMHYATTESVPWKGVTAPKAGEQRTQRDEENIPSDTDYLSAVKKGDTATAQRMVDEAAKAAGYTVGPVVHLTNNQDFTVFDLKKTNQGAVWGPAIYAAFKGAGNWDPANLQNARRIEGVVGGRVLDATQPLSSKDALVFKELTGREVETIPFITLERRFGSVAEGLRALGFSAMIHKGPGSTGQHIAVFDPTQIKSADPITKDNAGNVIPLSQRFQTSSADIRYQRGEEKTRKFAGRVAEAESVPEEVRQTVRQSPESQYEQQKVNEVVDRASSMTMTQLAADMADPESNTRVASGMETFSRQINSGDMAGASSTALSLSKSGTTWGQLINQFKLLNSSTPEGLVRLVELSLANKKRSPLTQQQAAILMDGASRLKLADNEVLAAGRVARDAFAANDVAAINQSIKQLDLADAKRSEIDVILNEAISKINPADAADLFISMVQGSVMGPISIVRNVVGNAINYPLRELGDAGAALIDGALSKDKNNSFNIRARTVDRIDAIGRSLPSVAKTLLKGSNAMPYELGTSIGNPLNFQRAWRRIAEDFAAGKIGSALSPRNLTEATIGILPDIMLRLTQATDIPFRQAERARIISEIGRTKGLSEAQIQIAVRDPKLAFVTDVEAQRGRRGFTEDDLATIETESARSVFQQDNTATKAVAGINRFIKNEIGSSGYIPYRLISLFQKTPINVAAEALQFTPAGALQDWSKMTPRDRNIAASRIAVGAMVTTAFGYLYHKGIITPNLDTAGETNKARELAKAGGVMPPGTINLSAVKRLVSGGKTEFQGGDTVVDLSSLGTAGALGIMAGTALRQSERGRTNEELMTTVFKGVPTSGLNFVMEQQFLKGTSDFIKLLSQESSNSMDRWLKNLAVTAATPLAPAVLGSVRRAERDKLPVIGGQSFIKDTVDELNQRYAALGLAIPGVKDPNAMPVRRDLWGQAVEQTPKGSNPWVYQFFNAWKAREIDADPLNTSIYTIWRRTADNSAIPSVPNPSLTWKQKTYERMAPEQFDRYSELVGQYRRLRAEQEFMRPRFQQGGDERKLKLLQRAYDDGLLIAKKQFVRELVQSGQTLTPVAARRGFQQPSE